MTLRLVDHCRGRLCNSMMVRMDAGFPEPGLLKGLESRSVPYIARIRNNEVLNRMAQPHLTQPARGRSEDEPREWFHEMTYQAESWNRARRVVLVVVEQPGKLYPKHFWLLTSLSRKRCEAPELLATYRKRGKPLAPDPKPEARTEAGVRPHNEVRFLLNLLAYEVLHLGRVLSQGRQLIFVVTQRETDWQRLWRRLAQVSWAPR